MMIMESVQVVSVSLPIKLVEKLDYYREDIPRSKFVHRLLEKGFEMVGNEQRSDSTKSKNLEKQPKSFDKVTKADIALGKLRNPQLEKQIRIEIEATCNSPISCLKREFLATNL